MLDTLTPPASGLTRQVIEERSRLRQEPDWLLDLRLRAFAAFERTPLVEQAAGNWRRANLAGFTLPDQTPLPGRPSARPAAGSPEAGLSGALAAEDGGADTVWLDPDLAARGVRLLDFTEALRDGALAPRVRQHLGQVVQPEEDTLTAYHYAFFNAGVVVVVPRNVQVEHPIRVCQRFAQPSLAALSHTLVLLDEGASLAYVDDFQSVERGGRLADGVVELVVGPNAQLRYVQLQRWASDVWAFSFQRAVLDRDAQLRSLNAALGGRLDRDTVQVILQGHGSQADLLGVVAADGKQHVDFQTLQDHHGSHTRSDLVIHNALRGRSSSNFTGLIRINPESRGTESSQQQKNILLSPHAKADSDPKLEILNNDVVRCTHGAAVGPVDPELVFYLQARGLDRAAAQALILQGFYQSVVDKLEMPELQTLVWNAVAAQPSALEPEAA